MYLRKTSEYLRGNHLTAAHIQQAAAILQEEITPISDARGSADYKRLLARQLFCGHFLEIFPLKFKMEELIWSI
jgi:xanthine dehydrogenase small subunit